MSDEKRSPTPVEVSSAETSEAQVDARLQRLSRRGFAIAGLTAVGAILGGRWLQKTAAPDSGVAWPLRRALEANEAISRKTFSQAALSPTFPRGAVAALRVNGTRGLDEEEFEPEEWRLALEGSAEGPVSLELSALQSLPRTEQITEFKCIEGWSTVAQWAGVRLSDLLRAHPPATRSGRPFDPARPDDLPPYLSLATPDGEYYVGLDAAAALHPQTLLAWEHDGAPLTLEHGAPLRLVIPVKYGVKSIKRVGVIKWQGERPADYWAEQGYDWYAGL